MQMADIKQVADAADMIVNGYAFTRCTEGYRVLNLNRQIVRQGTNYGVRLEACAPSIQMMKATIHTEISPIVGTEKQSEDLARSLLAGLRTTRKSCGNPTSLARACTSW